MIDSLPQNESRRSAGSHFVQVVGVRLDEDRHVGVFQRRYRAGFVAKVGQAQDHAVEFAPVLLQEVGVDFALAGGFDCAVAGGVRIQHQDVVARRLQDAWQFFAGFRDE